MDLDGAVRAVWTRQLKKLPLEMAIERLHYKIIAATIRDKGTRAMIIPKHLINKIEEELWEIKSRRLSRSRDRPR